MRIINLLAIFLVITSCTTNFQHIRYLNQKKPENVPQVFAPGIISNRNRFDIGFTISPNGKNIVFGVVDEIDSNANRLYFMNYINKKWQLSDNSFLTGNLNTFFPMFGADGDFYFAKSINGETDIWVSQYKDNKLINYKPLGSIFNSTSREAGFGKSINKAIYFTSNRGDNCCGDIYRSEPDMNGNYISVHKVKQLSTSADEESLFLSPNEDYIIIQAWRNEFQAKHDLYLSYRNKNGSWASPQRLDTAINTKEIEQRPFVSPDKKFLFFSRTSKNLENGIDVFESDIYWVCTKSIFKPYPYNTDIKFEIEYNKPFRIELPHDLFRHVTNTKMTYSAALENTSLPKWIEFNENRRILTGIWKDPNVDHVIIKAVDTYGNKSLVKIFIEVKGD